MRHSSQRSRISHNPIEGFEKRNWNKSTIKNSSFPVYEAGIGKNG